MKRTVQLVFCALWGLSLSLWAHQSEQQKLIASDAVPGDLFGSALTVEDAFMAIGAPGAAGGVGAVYVFEHDGVSWVESAKLTPPDGLAGDAFGSSLANHGHELVIGAPGHDAAGLDAGAAYCFVEVAGVWTMTQKLLAPVAAAGDEFGHEVTMTHGKIAVAAPREPSGGIGSVYVFSDANGTGPFTLEQELVAPDGITGNEFGFDLDFDGDTSIIVGAPHQNGFGLADGAAYLFAFDGLAWNLEQKLVANFSATGDHFGYSVGKYGKKVVIGALGDDQLGLNAGAMYSFLQLGGTWVQTLKKPGLIAGNQLGAAAAIHGRFYVGAQPKFGSLAPNAGQVRLWSGSLLVQTFVASDGLAGDELGTAVAMDTSWVVAGAPGSDAAGVDTGAVYVYLVLHPAVTTINGSGVNPTIMTTRILPGLGVNWEIEVDTSAWPTAIQSTLFVYRRSLVTPMATSFGEILLDLSSVFVLADPVFGAPGVLLHQIPIPLDPNLMGVTASAQALVGSSTALLTATNGEEILIGSEGGVPHSHP